MTDKKMLTVVVPFYNEAATIRQSLERLLKVDLGVEVEIVMVDDASRDGSAESIADLVEANGIKLIRHPANRGKGAAVRTGLDAASGDFITILDADLEYDPNDYKDLLVPLLEGESVVYGTRPFGGHTVYSFWYVIGNKFLSFWASLLFDTWLSDIETCFKVATREAWRSLDLRETGFGIEAEATAKFLKRKHRIYEHPISYRARTREEGKKLQWTDGLSALWILFKLRFLG